jgi:hypothetical protein
MSLENKYADLVAEKEKLSKEIVEVIASRMKRLVQLTLQEKELENELFKTGGDKLLEDLRDDKKLRFHELLYDLCDGVIQGYNMEPKDALEFAEEVEGACKN